MFYSPLRYPGGKGKMTKQIISLIEKTGHVGGTYIEPFAGGAGIAIELLEKGIVSEIVINDYDKGIYSFWRAILSETSRFIEDIEKVPLNMDEWYKQRNICMTKSSKYSYELGFATFYMNRTNRSGIIKGGVIGGVKQLGKWKLDARFNKKELINRINMISSLKNKIHLYNKDICSFVLKFVHKYEKNAFIYFDPPYFEKGKQLYMNYFTLNDHIRIKEFITEKVDCDWIITYDDVSKIKEIYTGYSIRKFKINYCVSKKRTASELIIFKNDNIIPEDMFLEA